MVGGKNLSNNFLKVQDIFFYIIVRMNNVGDEDENKLIILNDS